MIFSLETRPNLLNSNKKLREFAVLIKEYNEANINLDSLLMKAPNPTVKRIILTQFFGKIITLEVVMNKQIEDILNDYKKDCR